VKHDSTAGIWDKKYLVKIPTLDGTSTVFLKHHGTYVTGDRNIDRSVNQDWLVTYLNIDQMVEYFRKGVTIAVVNPSDTKLIYEAIEEHLNAWVEHLQFGLNTANAPIHDLIDMDNFANAVYAHAKRHISETIIRNALGRRMEARFGFTPASFFKPTKEEAQKKDEPERTPFSDFLKTKVGPMR